jgi:hypothetical protein
MSLGVIISVIIGVLIAAGANVAYVRHVTAGRPGQPLPSTPWTQSLPFQVGYATAAGVSTGLIVNALDIGSQLLEFAVFAAVFLTVQVLPYTLLRQRHSHNIENQNAAVTDDLTSDTPTNPSHGRRSPRA